MQKKQRFSFGPAILVTAAFIGPGTVMAASSAGAKFGFLLLWAIAFSVFATIILQEMAARLGIATGNGLSQALRDSIRQPLLRFIALGLVLLAIFVGNSAYQTGNILGAATGVISLQSTSVADPDGRVDGEPDVLKATAEKTPLNAVQDNLLVWNQNSVVLLIGGLAFCVIWIGRFDVLQGFLTLLVGLMSLIFIVAAILSGPSISGIAKGFVPSIPQGADWVVVGLIGTTVVPYNLFLHASAAAQRWKFDSDTSIDERERAIRSSRWDTIISVLIGGMVTCAILITASVAFNSADGAEQSLGSVKDVAIQLEPALGSWARTMFALGLLAAGMTSAITAPIAAGYAAAGCFGWKGSLSDWRLKVTASIVVLCGVVFAIQLGNSPKETIILAQVANGLLLPVIAIFLLVLTNSQRIMKGFKNHTLGNLFAVLVIVMVTLIASNQFRKVNVKLKAIWGSQASTIDPSVNQDFPLLRSEPISDAANETN